jgi:SAM-dependent methyltransferase
MGRRAQQLNQWFETPLGQRLLQAEAAAVAEVLPSFFGYHALQLGGMGAGRLLESSRIKHRCLATRYPPISPSNYSKVLTETDELPFATDSLDLVILPHVLEFEDSPHAVLREVERVLIPQGHVVILGFNPMSLWGLWRLLHPRRHQIAPWCGRSIGMLRLKDWLALLGFEIELQQTLFFAPPVNQPYLVKPLHFIENLAARIPTRFGAVYLIVAKKRVATLTPIRPRWRPRTSLVSGMVGTRYSEHQEK